MKMNPETFYRDHWAEIDEKRLSVYDANFVWQPRMAPLLEPAGLEPGQRVLDYGCGPGALVMEIARRVGPGGRVHGVDLNADMLTLARQRAEREGLGPVTEFEQVTVERLPFEDATFDRVVCKSVLEYVADPAATVAEFQRVTKPTGRVHVVDSDWGMLAVEPLAPESLQALFAAAAMAYRTPHIGRRLRRLFRDAGLQDVALNVTVTPDTTGARAMVVRNMIGYAREAGAMDDAILDDLLAQVEDAIANGDYLMMLPQFIVTGTR
ncbi:MAG: methyltransferase domain-containing protein [Chromatiales bacterium]|jgi:ubiquinone/menaquinone biosynthesis C-methylase UbiE|nr:methyltransferase domain-containing protein [Chromatiales bacterium]